MHVFSELCSNRNWNDQRSGFRIVCFQRQSAGGEPDRYRTMTIASSPGILLNATQMSRRTAVIQAWGHRWAPCCEDDLRLGSVKPPVTIRLNTHPPRRLGRGRLLLLGRERRRNYARCQGKIKDESTAGDTLR